jgi:heme/copper-type cytochrome/quinol oxidase subunit 2
VRARGWFFLALLLALPALAYACPTCKDALKDNAEAAGFARGIYISIFVMLGAVFGAVGIFIYKIVKMAREEKP